MKKIMISSIAILLIIILTFILAACSGDSSPNNDIIMTPDVPQIGKGTSEQYSAPFVDETKSPKSTKETLTSTPVGTAPATKDDRLIRTEKPVDEPETHELGIMVWNQISERTSDYGYYAPYTEMQFDLTRLKLPLSSLTPGPNQSITLSFSPYTHKIAYFTRITKTELWISDLQLTDIKRAWKDEQYWLGNISGKNDVLIRWGINDRYLVVSSILKGNHLLIYDLILDEYLEFEGNCDWIIKSPISGQLVIGCTIIQQDKQEFRILDINGIVALSASSHPLLTGLLDWSYAKDAKRILYITADKKIGILESDEKANYLPLMFETNSSLSLTWSKNLQWSRNGDRVLVYGFEPSPKLCPTQKNSGVENKITQRSCWFILDPSLGEILWWPKENIPEKLDIPWDYLRNEYDAALSPDGEWISTTFTDSRMGHAYYLLALSTVSDEVRVITLEQAHTIFWP